MKDTHSAESGMVLLGVLIMLAIGSMWTSYSWQQAFAQQRMMQHQTLEVLAWQAAEAGGMQLWRQYTRGSCPKTGGALLEGVPSARWQIIELLDAEQICSLVVAGEVVDSSTHPSIIIARAHLLLEITETGEPLLSSITRWQRIYPR